MLNKLPRNTEGRETDEQAMLEHAFADILEPFGWRFCFVNDTELFFQSEATDFFENTFGDLPLQMREQEFSFLSQLEQEVFKPSNFKELLNVDTLFTIMDAYLSLAQNADSF